MKLEHFEKPEMLVLSYSMNKDLKTLENILPDLKTSWVNGFESLQNDKVKIEHACSYIKETYGEEVEPSIAGLEGFVDTLKAGIEKIRLGLKSDQSKNNVIFKGSFKEIETAANLYKSQSWVSDKTFIDKEIVISVPTEYGTNVTPDDILKYVKKIVSSTLPELEKSRKNLEARLKNANTELGKAVKAYKRGEDMDEYSTTIPEIKPELYQIQDKIFDSLIPVERTSKDLKLKTMKQTDLSVVNECFKVIIEALKRTGPINDLYSLTMDIAEFEEITYEDSWDGDLESLFDVIDTHTLDDIGIFEWRTFEGLLRAAKTLESWLLKSIK